MTAAVTAGAPPRGGELAAGARPRRQGPQKVPPGRAVGLGRAVGGGQAAAVASLVGLVLLVYALPAVLGHPVVPGDDLSQNLPLRELVGKDLRAGELPVFDPYIWSGAPLLAGWNAGAAYPLTWLFALVPAAAAWTLNLVAAGIAAGVGAFAFLRASKLSVLASWAGAITFAFSGGMVAQVPHVGLVIGMSWIPLGLLALLRLTQEEPITIRARCWWTAVLATSVGLVILAGEPRAVADGAAVLVLSGAWRVLRFVPVSWRATSTAAASCALGAVVGVGLGAVQLVPGIAAVATSQRAGFSDFLFGAGSLPDRWLALLGVPDLLGGSGSFGQPVFFAHYNLTEVTGYVGLLPLCAALALFAKLRRGRTVPEWLIWEVVALAGILLALGKNTPLWHLFIHIPLLSGQRLQSRGILVADLAFAVLLAHWLDSWAQVPPRAPDHGMAESTDTDPSLVGRALGALPVVAVLVVVVATLAAGPAVLRWMGVGAHAAAHAAAIRPWLVPPLILATGALALVISGPRLAPATRRVLVAAFVVLDLLVFNATAVVAIGVTRPGGAETNAAETNAAGALGPTASRPGPARRPARDPSRALPISTLHLSGRFAVYDPGLLDPAQLAILGVPDANALSGTSSVQGYGSIVDRHYAAATGVHGVSGSGQDVFEPRAATDGVFDALSTRAVFAPSPYLRTPTRGADTDTVAGTRHLTPGRRVTWFVGSPVVLRSAHLEVRATAAAGQSQVGEVPDGEAPAGEIPDGEAPAGKVPVRAEKGGVRIGALTTSGHLDWGRMRAPRAAGSSATSAVTSWNATWPSATSAVALVVTTTTPAVSTAPVVTDTAGQAYALVGVLQRAMVAPHWRYWGQDGAFAVFFNRRARPSLSLRPPPGGSLGGAAIQRLSGPALDPQSAFVTSPGGVDVVRAVADVPGWTALWRPAGVGKRRATALAVHRLGTVQIVRVPAGSGVVSWRYAAPGLFTGELVSATALAVLLGLLAGAALFGRGRRTRSP